MRLILLEYTGFTRPDAMLQCGYCSRTFEISVASMRSRLRRWGIVKCLGCGATLEGPLDDRRSPS